MFEICLVEDYEDIFFMRDYEFNLNTEEFNLEEIQARN